MRILNEKIELGTSVVLKMNFARLNTRAKIDIPVIVERGKKEGPCILIIGGIHGDETNGVEIVRQIVTKGYNKPKSGTVICIPLLNVFGFLNKTREFPDGRDLNRVFPGSKKGSLASRFAYHLMNEIIPHIDYCIDFHTGGAQRFNHPQIRIDEGNEELLKLAKVFNSPFIVYSKSQERTFRKTLANMGKKVLLFEGGKSLNLNENVTNTGILGVINVLHYLGFRDYSSKIPLDKIQNNSIIIKDSKWVRAKHSGMYRSYVSAGNHIDRGVKLGSISDPFGEYESVFKNSKRGHILNSNHAPVVNQGDALLHIGYE